MTKYRYDCLKCGGFGTIKQHTFIHCDVCGIIGKEDVGDVRQLTPETCARVILGKSLGGRGGEPVTIPFLVMLRSKGLVKPGLLTWGRARILYTDVTTPPSFLMDYPSHLSHPPGHLTVTSLAVHADDWLDVWIDLVDGDGLVVMAIE